MKSAEVLAEAIDHKIFYIDLNKPKPPWLSFLDFRLQYYKSKFRVDLECKMKIEKREAFKNSRLILKIGDSYNKFNVKIYKERTSGNHVLFRCWLDFGGHPPAFSNSNNLSRSS